MEISARQISAALALSGVSQAVFAESIGMTSGNFSLIVNRKVTPKAETMRKMMEEFNRMRIEFLPRDGVCVRDDVVRRLEGDDCYIRLHDEITQTMRDSKDDVLFFMVDESKSSEQVRSAKKRMRDAGIKCRHLCEETATQHDGPRHEYRAVPSEFYTNRPQVIFGDFVATTSRNPNLNIIIIQSQSVAAAERGKFEFFWNHCPMIKEGA